MSPYITVTIVAFDRREFLDRAIDSVLGQSLDKSLFEVIVVSNFEIEPEDQKQGVKYFYSDSTSYGAKLLVTLKLTSSTVVALLDDDDVFKPEKLAYVYDEFIKNERLGYLHNNYDLIDLNDHIVPRTHRPFDLSIGYGTITVSADQAKTLARLNHRGVDFNHSCITFRRSILESHLSQISSLSGSLDSATYFLCLAAGLEARVTEEKLSDYRIHETTSSQYTQDVNRLRSWLGKEITNYTTLKTILLEENNTRLADLVANKIFDAQIVEDIVVRSRKKDIVSHLFGFLLTAKFVSSYQIFKAMLAISNIISHRLAWHMYTLYTS